MFNVCSNKKNGRLIQVGIIVACFVALASTTAAIWWYSMARMAGAVSMWSETTLMSWIIASAATAPTKVQRTTPMTTKRWKPTMNGNMHSKKERHINKGRKNTKKSFLGNNDVESGNEKAIPNVMKTIDSGYDGHGNDDDNSNRDDIFRFELEYKIEAKHWYKISPFMDSYDETVLDSIDNFLFNSSEYQKIFFGYDAGGGFCSGPWYNWHILHCFRTTMHLEMKPDANHQDYKELERELSNGFVGLFNKINGENKKDFQADLVRPPHEPLDLVEFQYRLQVNPDMINMANDTDSNGRGDAIGDDEWERMDHATDILLDAVFDAFISNPNVTGDDASMDQSGTVCGNYKEHEIVTCVDWDVLLYTGIDGTGSQAGAIALATMIETAKKYNWFNITFPSKF